MVLTTGMKDIGGFGFRDIVIGAVGFGAITSAGAIGITATSAIVIAIIATGIANAASGSATASKRPHLPRD